MQVQIFLANPDMSETSMPKAYQIKELMESMNNYKRNFIIKNENEEIIKTHTWKDPYPKMFFKEKEISNDTNNQTSEEKNKLIKENLTCFLTKVSIFDDPNIILGYPIVKETFGKIYPIPEILSYEGYLTQISNKTSKYDTNSLKSANNKYYNSWLPIYINKNNFEANKQTILNSFSVIKYGISGEKDYDFKPEYIYEIMYKLINQMVWDIKEQKISSSYLRAFFQYIFLYKKLSQLYPYDYQKNELNLEDVLFINAFILKLREIMFVSFFEKFELLEKNLNNLKEELKNYLAILFFLEKKECDLNSPKEFVEYIEKNNLFNPIYEIMRFERNLFLYNGKNLKKIIKKLVCNSFKNFILNSDENTIDNLKRFFMSNFKFSNFVDFNQFLDKGLDENSKKNINDIFSNFIILCYIKKKINEKNFLEQLENNFGIYLEIDEILEKLNEIKNNLDIYYEKEIEYLDKSLWENIQNNIQELFILYNNINKIPKKQIRIYEPFHYFIEDYFAEFEGFRILNFHLFDGLFTSNFVGISRNYFSSRNINDYKKNSNSFEELRNMNLNTLKLLYLYSFQRMKKCINPNNKNLSLIESKFFEYSFNNNKNNCQWYNYILKRQTNIDKEEKVYPLNKKQFFKLFYEAKKLNEVLFSDNEIIERKQKKKNKIKIIGDSYKTSFISKAVIKNIAKFAEIILGKAFDINNLFVFGRLNFTDNYYYVEIEPFLIERLKEIYETGDIALLTFYEFLWLEEHYNLFFGFLSSIGDKRYNFTMRDCINKIKNAENKSIKKINKKEKRNYNIIIKKKFKSINKINLFGTKKLGLWKIFRPCKIKKTNYFKYILGNKNNH